MNIGPGRSKRFVPRRLGVHLLSGLTVLATSLLVPREGYAQEGTISGTVSEQTGASLEGVEVRATVRHVSEAGVLDDEPRAYEATSSRDGTYRLDIPVPGLAAFVVVTFDDPNSEGSSDAVHTVALDPGETVTLDPTLGGTHAASGDAAAELPAKAKGRVYDRDREPIEGVSVMATITGKRYEDLTGASGTFELELPVSEPDTRVVLEFAELDEDGQTTGNESNTLVLLGPGDSIFVHMPLFRGHTATDSDPAATSDATLLAYLPYDGVPPAETARGLETEQLLFGGEDVEAIEGRYDGGALYRSGSLTLLPLDIDPLTHPRITVTAWVLLDEAWEDSETGTLLGVGWSGSGAPQLRLTTKRTLEATAGAGRAVYHAAPLPLGEWTHVAAVWDYRARTLRLHVGEADSLWTDRVEDPAEIAANDRTQPRLEHPKDDERPERRYVLLGAADEGGSRALGRVGVDDLRIYAGALTPEEIAAIRESEGGPADPGEYAIAPPPPEPEDDTGDRGELVDWRLSEDYELSDVSGSSGDQRRRRLDFVTSSFYGVGIGEQRNTNRPCYLSVRTVHPDLDVRGAEPPYCDDPVMYYVEVGQQNAATGLQVCQNRLNDRLKGLRLAARRLEIDQDAGQVDFREQDLDTNWQPNCSSDDQWANPVSCDAGQVASGLYVHYNRVGRTQRQEIVGLQLICRDVVGVFR